VRSHGRTIIEVAHLVCVESNGLTLVHANREQTKVPNLLYGAEVSVDDAQLPVRRIVADFYVPGYKLVVEIDGSSHNACGEYDARRDQRLKERYGVQTVSLRTQWFFETRPARQNGCKRRSTRHRNFSNLVLTPSDYANCRISSRKSSTVDERRRIRK
jgi:hypothetical protein